MEELLNIIAVHVALALEAVSVLIVAFGSVEALARSVGKLVAAAPDARPFRPIWASFGRWLLLALLFSLAADIVRSAISPTWEDIGRLAAIAAIRTFLSLFLERDMGEIKDAIKASGKPDQ